MIRYKNEIIQKNNKTGYWTCLCFASGGYLVADTLFGIKKLISNYK